MTSLVENPVIRQLHTAVVEDRNRITELVGSMQKMECEFVQSASQALPLIPAIPASATVPMPHALDDSVMPPPKRLKTAGQQNPDVLYGPVDTEGNPRAIAKAAMELIPGLQLNDVYSAQYVPGQMGVISIRFRDHDKADEFMTAIERKPLLQGQTAVPAGAPARPPAGRGNVGSVGQQQPAIQSPIDIIRGVGKSVRGR
jgi:hypothetical protein